MKTAERQILAKGIRTTPEALLVDLENRVAVIPWSQVSPRLAAGAAERSIAQLSPSGYGIHWPLLDEDLAVGPLVGEANPGA